MENLISFCRTPADGKIMLATGYKPFGEVPIENLQINLMQKKAINDFLKKMDITLYCLNEVVYLYFFYKTCESLRAVKYSNYLGTTEIVENIEVTQTLQADDFGRICVFVPGLFAPVK